MTYLEQKPTSVLGLNTSEKLQLLKYAYEYARDNSTDKSTQNGAFLIATESFFPVEPLIFGCNHFPDGVIETPERWTRPLKYSFVEHAERDVIYKAARNGIGTDGLTMVVCWAACADCGRAIIEAGIKHVITHKVAEHDSPQWKESIAIADQMFKEAGIKVDRVEGPIGVSVLFSGKLVER